MSITKRYFVLSLLAVVGICANVNAAPVTYAITTTETFPDTGNIYTGALVIDDSFLTPNIFIEAINLTSFGFSILGESFVKADILTPEDTGSGAFGFLTDDTGTELAFATTTPGPVFNLVNAADFLLGFDSANPVYRFRETANTTLISAGPWTLSQVPLPPAVWLFGSGLLGLVGIARRKKAV